VCFVLAHMQSIDIVIIIIIIKITTTEAETKITTLEKKREQKKKINYDNLYFEIFFFIFIKF